MDGDAEGGVVVLEGGFLDVCSWWHFDVGGNNWLPITTLEVEVVRFSFFLEEDQC